MHNDAIESSRTPWTYCTRHTRLTLLVAFTITIVPIVFITRLIVPMNKTIKTTRMYDSQKVRGIISSLKKDGPTKDSCIFHMDDTFETKLKELAKTNTANTLPITLYAHRHLRKQPMFWQYLKQEKAWNYCLPLTTEICKNSSKQSLLYRDGNGTSIHNPVCYSAVLHLLLEDMFEAAHNVSCTMLLVHGTLLGAIRGKTIIPHTEDVDIGLLKGQCDIKALREVLWEKGIFLFKRNSIYSWCLVSHHPLSHHLYDPVAPIVKSERGDWMVPYGDIYNVEKKSKHSKLPSGTYTVACLKGVLGANQTEPFSCATINGNEYPVWQKPEAHLLLQYGQNWKQIGDHWQRNGAPKPKAWID